MAAYATLTQCIETVPKFSAAKLIPTTLEYIKRDVIAAAEKFLGKNFPEKTSNAFLLITFDGNTKDEIDVYCDQAADICLSSGANDVYICDTEERRESVWSIRSATLEAIKATSEELDECDVVVPRNKIAEFEKYARLVCDEIDLRVITIGHAGDGNVHVSLCRDHLPEKEWHDKVKNVLNRLYKKAKEFGGQVSGEHGIGHSKIDVLRDFVGEKTYELFKAIKMVFDKKNILNPGKIVK